MSESSRKQMKFTGNFPEDFVEYIMSVFLPIQTFFRSRAVSKRFKDVDIQSQDLDFSGIYSVRRRRPKVVRIIESVFNQHKGSEINRFILFLNHIGVEDKILSWIEACRRKNIQELVLDFSRSKKVMDVAVDFWTIETLTVLKLRWCKFTIPGNSSKGLRLLKTLALMRTKVKQEMIDSVFNNCIHLESLELIKCRMYGILRINAHNHKKFKSFIVFSMPDLFRIILEAPTLEYYMYYGYLRMENFSNVNALKKAELHYKKSYVRHYYNPSGLVLSNMEAYTKVHVLATTNIFLEALTYRYKDGGMRKPSFWFPNLREFQILLRAPTTCTLFDITEFLTQCPKLEKVKMDIDNFTFELGFYWKLHQKRYIHIKYQKDVFKSIKEVEINGYKAHWHELDIVLFFAKNAQSLEKLILTAPINSKIQLNEADHARINDIKNIFPTVELKGYHLAC